MTLNFDKNKLKVKKALNHWDQVYRYEAFLENQRLQLYSIFFKEKQNLFIFHKIAEHLMALKEDYYLQIKGITAYSRDEVFDRDNLQILTEYAKTTLVNDIKQFKNRSMKLSAREVTLILKAFIQVLHDLVKYQDNFVLFHYLQAILKCDLFNSIHLNNDFQVKINLLPDMSNLDKIDWSVFMQNFQGDVGGIIQNIVYNFIKQFCPCLPLKLDSAEILSNIMSILSGPNRYWHDVFVLPEYLMNIVFEMLNVSRENYEEKIPNLYNLIEEDQFNEQAALNLSLQYKYESKPANHALKFADEPNFFKFLHNTGVGESIAMFYFPSLVNQPREHIDLSKTESFTVQFVDISIIVLSEMTNIEFTALKRLSLQACGITSESLRIILGWKYINQIEALDFSGTETHSNLIGSKGCVIIANCERLQNLKELSLSCCRIDDEALEHLCGSPNLTNLETLILSSNRLITKQGYKLINETPNLKGLKNLNLLSCRIGFDNLVELLKPSENCKKYQELNLCECEITREGLELICQSEATQSLKALYVDANNFQSVNGWQAPQKLTNLIKLSAQFCQLDDRIMDSFLSFAVLENLEYLDVSFNELLVLDIPSAKKMYHLKELLIEATLVDHKFLEKLTSDDEKTTLQKLSLRRGSQYSTIFEKIAKTGLVPDLNFVSMDRISNFQINLFFLYFPFSETSNSLETLHFHTGIIDPLLWKSSLYNNLYFGHLAELKFTNLISCVNSSIVLISKSEKMRNLKVLEVFASPVGDSSLAALTRPHHLISLKKLVISTNLFSPQIIRKFLVSDLCSRLDYLNLAKGTPITEKQKKLKVYAHKYHKALTFEI